MVDKIESPKRGSFNSISIGAILPEMNQYYGQIKTGARAPTS
jgi:hypothetical protein